MAPKTQDPEYESRKKTLEDLHDAMRNYATAMEKVKIEVKEAARSLTAVKAVFDQLAEIEAIPTSTRDLVANFSATADRITGDYLTGFTESMDRDVIPAVLGINKLTDECAQYQSTRNKTMREYDVYRNEVAKKESEYAKKNKDLTTSRGYNADVVRRDELKERFQSADQKFKDCHDFILQNVGRTVNRCMATFFGCSATFSNSIAEEFETLLESARELEQAVPSDTNGDTHGESDNSDAEDEDSS